MPIRNYTSKMSPNESIGTMMDILAEMDARNINVRYDEARRPVSLTFTVEVRGIPIPFRLDVEPEATLEAMKEDSGVPGSRCTEEQALRTAWKNKCDWLDVMLAQIRESNVDVVQMFLGFAVIDEDGRTAYDLIQEEPGRLVSGDRPKQLPPHTPTQ